MTARCALFADPAEKFAKASMTRNGLGHMKVQQAMLSVQSLLHCGKKRLADPQCRVTSGPPYIISPLIDRQVKCECTDLSFIRNGGDDSLLFRSGLLHIYVTQF